jgi:hypothetical protein
MISILFDLLGDRITFILTSLPNILFRIRHSPHCHNAPVAYSDHFQRLQAEHLALLAPRDSIL